jgi:predicted phage tail protein
MSGGKGGGSDSSTGIRSQSTIKVVDALCEGEIEGLVNGLKSVYYNRVAVQNADDTYNQKIDNFVFRSGTQTQGYLPGFGEVQSEQAVGQPVEKAIGPVTRTITTPGLDSLRVTISCPRLITYNDKGNSSNATIKWKVYLKINNGAFIEKDYVQLDRKSTSGFEYQSTLRIGSTYTILQVRVERITDDSTDDKVTNAISWKSYTEVIEEKFAYPNIAIAGSEVSGENLSGSVPARLYHIKALRVKIPTNATVNADGSLTYTGVWNGTFTTPVWCADPAWCLYDLLGSERYGARVAASVLAKTKWDFYTASLWCNGSVSNGAGGVEPRFLLSVVIDREFEAYDLILQLCNVFNGVFYLLGEGIALNVDSPGTPVAILTNENTKFNYATTSFRSRITVVLVEFSNPDDFGAIDIEPVVDDAGVALYGYQTKRITAVGCGSRSQAHRFGRWYLYTVRQQTTTLTAMTGLLGGKLKPGEIVFAADKFKTPYQGGRIINATPTRVVLDSVVTLAANTLYELVVVLPNGSIDRRLIRTLLAPADYLNPIAPYSIAPLAESIWILIPQTQSLRQYRVISATPQSEQGQYTLSLIQHSPGKYAEIQQGLVVDPPVSNRAPTPPNPPRNLSALVESAVGATGTTYSLEVGWNYPINSTGQADSYTSGYQVQYRNVSNTAWTTLTSTSRSLSLPGLAAGSYIVQVAAINLFGSRSSYITSPAILVGATINASANFTNFESAIFVAMQANV